MDGFRGCSYSNRIQRSMYIFPWRSPFSSHTQKKISYVLSLFSLRPLYNHTAFNISFFCPEKHSLRTSDTLTPFLWHSFWTTQYLWHSTLCRISSFDIIFLRFFFDFRKIQVFNNLNFSWLMTLWWLWKRSMRNGDCAPRRKEKRFKMRTGTKWSEVMTWAATQRSDVCRRMKVTRWTGWMTFLDIRFFSPQAQRPLTSSRLYLRAAAQVNRGDDVNFRNKTP